MKRYIFILFITITFVILQTSFASTSDLGIKKVVIDAGHGGKDSGCVGAKSNEKEVVLAIALKLGEYIEKNIKGVEVIYTRKTDKFLELHERAKIANDNKADLFICIHANAGKKSAFGTETFVMGLHRSDANLIVAKRENSSILMEENYDVHYEGFDPNSPESYVALSLIQSAFLEQSLNFSAKVQKQFTIIGRNDRGVKQAGFLVLYKTTMPSVLIETGFLTNNEEENFLISEKNQEKIALAILEAFKDYKSEFEKKITVSEQKQVVEPKTKKNSDIKKTGKGKNGTVGKNKTSTTNNKNETLSQELLFKVQVVSSSKQIPLEASNFNGLENVSFYQQEGLYKYTIGNEKSLESVSPFLQKAREKGYKGAFIVALLEGKRIDMNKALKMLNK